MNLGSNRVDRLQSLLEIPTRLRGTDFCTNSVRFAPSFVSKPNFQNAPKLFETRQNMSLGCNGVDRMRSLREILTRLRGNEPFAHEFRVQWGESVVFLAKNFDAISWHELLR